MIKSLVVLKNAKNVAQDLALKRLNLFLMKRKIKIKNKLKILNNQEICIGQKPFTLKREARAAAAAFWTASSAETRWKRPPTLILSFLPISKFFTNYKVNHLLVWLFLITCFFLRFINF